VLVGLVLVALLGACGDEGGDAADPTGAVSGELTVFAASSLADAFNDIKAELERRHDGLRITYNFAGSPQLVTQLVEGADADVFAAANTAQMQAAFEAGVVDGAQPVFARNLLAIVVPRDNPGDINAPQDLGRPGLKLVVANPEVPVGRYTLEALDKMSAAAGYGADFRARVEANIVSQEDNVRQVAAKVQLGEADAGLVYATDVTEAIRDDVWLVEIPEALNVVAAYPIARVTDGRAELAQAFIDFVLSDAGQAILREHGFSAPE
jgi:molybdate transport system substrate-binding protein